MPLLSCDRSQNRNKLKTLIDARRRKGRALAGALGGIEKRHTDMAASAGEMRQIVAAFSAALSTASAGAGAGAGAPTAECVRRMDAAAAAVRSVQPLLERVVLLLTTEEAANQRAADAARTAERQLNTFVGETMAEVNGIASAVTDVNWQMMASPSLRPGNELVDPQGRVYTSLARVNLADRSFSRDTNTLFARRRGSAPRKPNLPGTAAARARAAEGVAPVRPDTT